MSKVRNKLLMTLRTYDQWMTSKELSEKSGVSENSIHCAFACLDSDNVMYKLNAQGARLYRYKNNQYFWSMALNFPIPTMTRQQAWG
ncbi:hypothetical protein [Dongshaea marina]|uniref:hypothetical protein n=1 Tax=Dongshaea marina TaxID=2047966 RepID=UPI000D3EA40F|nr:hypothetical protein [Dongshaea marina]